jgi:L-threonylcarbamoyladenylate synthase
LRVPDHPVALALLRRAGCPIAAPSANRSESISPTTARHVAESLGPWVDDLLVLDGGPCPVGIESTVVDETGGAPLVLRPGMLQLELADAERVAAASGATAQPAASGTSIARSPGQRSRHYAPSKPLRIVAPEEIDRIARPGDGVLRLPPEPAAAAACLYAELRRLEADPDVERILVASPPEAGEWVAIRDRLRRASSGA